VQSVALESFVHRDTLNRVLLGIMVIQLESISMERVQEFVQQRQVFRVLLDLQILRGLFAALATIVGAEE
jgi:hypothetical protein